MLRFSGYNTADFQVTDMESPIPFYGMLQIRATEEKYLAFRLTVNGRIMDTSLVPITSLFGADLIQSMDRFNREQHMAAMRLQRDETYKITPDDSGILIAERGSLSLAKPAEVIVNTGPEPISVTINPDSSLSIGELGMRAARRFSRS